MSSPVGIEHGRAHVPVLVWLSYYAEGTPGVEVLDNASAILGRESEPQPDAMMRILPEYGGRTVVDRGILRGAPELVVEVAKSSRAVDLGAKRLDYERAGVMEYLVRSLDPDEVVWMRQDRGRLAPAPPDADGLYRSVTLPGLWLDPAALLRVDTRRLRAVVDLGLASAEHMALVARLDAASARGR